MSGLEEIFSVLEEAKRHLGRYASFCRNHLGETQEEQNQTLRLFKGLTPGDVRDALQEYRERRALFAHLDKGASAQEVKQ
jgi:hypothetical protein